MYSGYTNVETLGDATLGYKAEILYAPQYLSLYHAHLFKDLYRQFFGVKNTLVLYFLTFTYKENLTYLLKSTSSHDVCNKN